MSKEVNKAAIGGFVIGAVVLAVISLLVFGSGRFFQKKSMHVMFFQGSVKGLNIGAPVKFRGVDIGLVKNIQLTINPQDLEFYVPVYVEIFKNRISILGGEGLGKEFNDEEGVDTLVKEMGLRAQLQMQSFVTGQLFVNYDFYPETPIKKVGLEKKVYEVPTIPTTLQVVTETAEKILADLRRVNFNVIIEDIAQTAEGVNELVNSTDMQESIAAFKVALQDMQTLIHGMNEFMGNVNGKIDSVAENFSSTMSDTRELVNNLDTRLDSTAADLQGTLEVVQSSFAKAESLLEEAEKLITRNSDLRREVINALESMSDASRSLEELTDYLQRHPDSLLTGKK
ncbi:MAG: MCE family protein [Deltaproteobacteria bacterium]|jgi:paraquat-inducible protein B|nr:MCE family protein [Deltaproteobacteria bacterium]